MEDEEKEEKKEKDQVPASRTDSSTSDVQLPPEEPKGVTVPQAQEPPVLVQKFYMGKLIISEKMTVLNEKEYHSLTFVDGSTQLLSPAEYEEAMK